AHASGGESKGDGSGVGVAIEHRCAIERKNAHAFEAQSWALKQIDRQVIGTARLRFSPQRHLGVVAYPRGLRRLMLDRVEEPAAADEVGGLRHGDALKEWAGARDPARKRKVTDHPAISDLIIHNKWISPVLASTARCSCTQGAEERVV